MKSIVRVFLSILMSVMIAGVAFETAAQDYLTAPPKPNPTPKPGPTPIPSNPPKYIKVESVKLNASEIELIIGQSLQLIATVSPSNAIEKQVSWSSSNPAVATVNQSGAVTAKGIGVAVITGTSNNIPAICIVTVKDDEKYSNVSPEVAALMKAAEKGDAEAQCKLGVCYENGDGVPQEYAKAVEWYTKAADQGLAEAQYKLGLCYKIEKGVPKNYAKAIEWYTKAADQGHAEAQCGLGLCYEHSQGVPQDYVKAAEWYTKAARQGDANAQFLLGTLYSNGTGVPKDFAKGVEWFTKSAEQGNQFGQFLLGVSYLYGAGVNKDVAKARMWLQRSADQGNKDAIEMLKKL